MEIETKKIKKIKTEKQNNIKLSKKGAAFKAILVFLIVAMLSCFALTACDQSNQPTARLSTELESAGYTVWYQSPVLIAIKTNDDGLIDQGLVLFSFNTVAGTEGALSLLKENADNNQILRQNISIVLSALLAEHNGLECDCPELSVDDFNEEFLNQEDCQFKQFVTMTAFLSDIQIYDIYHFDTMIWFGTKASVQIANQIILP